MSNSNLSKRAAEFHAKYRRDHPLPDKKRCPRCREWKPATNQHWSMKKYTYANGDVIRKPASWCRACDREAKRIKYQSLSVKERRELIQRRKAQTNVENRRRYQREWATAKRREMGIKPVTPRVEAKNGRQFLDKGPILKYLEDKPLPLDESLARRIREIRKDNTKTVEFSVVDKLLVYYHDIELLDELYPMPTGQNDDG